MGAAVPIGISRNICLESALMIGELIALARDSARSVFPTAVGPVRTSSVFIVRRGCCRRSSYLRILPGRVLLGRIRRSRRSRRRGRGRFV